MGFCTSIRGVYFLLDNNIMPYHMRQAVVIGRIFEILSPDQLASDGVVTVKVFELSNMLHPDFDMPVLQQTDKYCTIGSKVCEYGMISGLSNSNIIQVCSVQVFCYA